MRSPIHRRSLMLGTLATMLNRTRSTRAQSTAASTLVAAVQMYSVPGDIDGNLQRAENWALHAINRGARWIVLPEFFTSGMSFRPDTMQRAARPIDGQPTRLLVDVATKHHVFVGGSFLVQSGKHVVNTFVLACPDGRTLTHDKDFPSGYVEHAFYAGGEDKQFQKLVADSPFETRPERIPERPGNITSGLLPVNNQTTAGCALCWEGLRCRTARRLRGKADVILASSSWGLIDAEVGVAEVTQNDLRRWGQQSVKLLRAMPGKLARMVGAPVIHANQIGGGWSQDARKDKPPMFTRAMGESQIVDASGNVVARRSFAQGEGIVEGKIAIQRLPPAEAIPQDAFWIPEVGKDMHDDWLMGGASGRDFYLNHR